MLKFTRIYTGYAGLGGTGFGPGALPFLFCNKVDVLGTYWEEGWSKTILPFGTITPVFGFITFLWCLILVVGWLDDVLDGFLTSNLSTFFGGLLWLVFVILTGVDGFLVLVMGGAFLLLALNYTVGID